MDKKTLYDAITAAQSGAVYVNELTAGLLNDHYSAANGLKEIDNDQHAETLQTIRDGIENIENILSNLLKIHNEEIQIKNRLEAIEISTARLSYLERPELPGRDQIEAKAFLNPEVIYRYTTDKWPHP